MKIRFLRLENYRRYRLAELELPDGVLAIVGPNGSGKSTLLEAIGFALFGTPATRTAKAQLRHANAAPTDAVRVTIQLELSGQAVEVVREFRGANLTAHASLTVDDKPLVSGGANSHGAVTQEMERLLGLDRTAFFTSVVAQQKELSRLTDLKAAERKQLILKMLGVDALDRAIDEARTNRRSAQQRVDDLRDTLPDGKALKAEHTAAHQAAEAAYKQVEQTAATWDAAKATLATAQQAFQEAQTAVMAHDTARRAMDAATQELQRLEKDRERNEAALVEANNSAEQAAKLSDVAATRPQLAQQVSDAQRLHDQAAANQAAQAEADALQRRLAGLPQPTAVQDATRPQLAEQDAAKALASAQQKLAASAAQRDQVQAHRQRIDGADAEAPCPFCDRPLHDQLPALRDQLESQQQDLEQDIKTHQGRLQELEQAHQAARQAMQAWQQDKHNQALLVQQRTELEERLAQARNRIHGDPANLPDLEALRSALKEAEVADRKHIKLQALAGAAPKLAKELEATQGAIRRSQGKLKEAQAALNQAPPVDLAPLQSGLDEATRDERESERAHHDARSKHRLAEQACKHIEARLAELDIARQRVKEAQHDLRLWTALAGGRNTGLLEQFRSHLVGKIRPAINAEASRLLARFTDGRYSEMLLDEDYGVFVVDDGIPYALERFSGGESDVAHLALRLAVSRLLTRRSGAAELRFLALDEVFGSLDRQRRDAVLGALHGLEDLYAQVVVVTHQEDMRDGLDAVLEVHEDGDGSSVRFHHG